MRFFSVRQSRGHGPGRYEHHGHMAKVQRSNEQPRHDLVAHAQQKRCIKRVVRQCHRCGHGNHVAAEETQLHAGCALGNAIAHGWHSACHLGCGAMAARFFFKQVRIVLHRRMGRQHVVVRGHDTDVGCVLGDDAQLVVLRQTCKGMRYVGAAHPLGAGRALRQDFQPFQVSATCWRAAFADALRDCSNSAMKGDGCHAVPLSRMHSI